MTNGRPRRSTQCQITHVIIAFFALCSSCSECLSCYNSAVEILMENNKFSMGAKIWKEIGTLQEKEHDLKGALASYAKAADCYEADNATVSGDERG